MKLHLRGRLFLVAAVLAAAAVFALGLFFAAQGVRSVVAGPTADPAGPVPNPGHAWTAVEGHGVDGSAVYTNTDGGEALELRVDSARALRLEPNATSPNVIEGYSGNTVTAGALGAAIGGGGASALTNRVTDNYSTIGGGRNNQAGDGLGTTSDQPSATVGGGYANTASANSATVAGGYTNTASRTGATVGGGGTNTASGADYATVGGGWANTASGGYAAVGGGGTNTASGAGSTVPGGVNNTAAGNYSFAAGNRAKANNQGCFVWGDATAVDYTCSTDNRFMARANGGVRLDVNNSEWVEIYDDGTNLINTSAGAPGARLTIGGTWTNASSRDQKENFTPVDGQAVLANLAAMPITTWNHKVEDPSIRHLGPVAQDFYAAFGLGDSATSIGTLDADGVALAAIQGLYEMVQELQAENAGLEARVTALEGGAPAPAKDAPAGPLSPNLSAGWLLLGGLVVGGLVLVQRRRAGGRR